jgi:hypothetical protein
MPSYRIHRLKDHLRQAFRSAPHVSGAAQIKPRDYEPGDTIEASSPYAAFLGMREAGHPLEVGDVLEDERGALRICKFVGFEEAEFVVPEAKVHEVTQPGVTHVEAGAVE